MSRSQGKPITEDEIRRIQVLLADTDLTMTMIAERMNCTRSSISKINKEFQIRSYAGQRSSWQAGEGVNTSAQCRSKGALALATFLASMGPVQFLN